MATATKPDPTPLNDLSDSLRHVRSVAGPSLVAVGRRRRGVGIVIGPDRVLTNAHNLRDRTTQLTFADGRAVQASLVGSDPGHDLVVLDADTGDMAPLAWSDAEIEVGDVVFAAGFGADGARISFGAVSAVSQPFRGPRGRRIKGAIEHTAPLPRGSSGGPVLDASGTVIGINTHRLGEGFYLALGAGEQMQRRVDQLVAGAHLGTRRLGIRTVPADATARMRRRVGLDDRAGLLVAQVLDDSPAATAGLGEGDLIVALDATPVTSVDDLWDAIDQAGETVTVTAVRGTDERTVDVTFTEPAPADTK